MDAQKQTEKLLQLKTQVTDVLRLRAEAESAVKFAHQQLKQVESSMVEMGIKPEDAEQELKALSDQIDVMTGQLETAIATERAEYLKILDSTKSLFETPNAAR